MWYFGKVKGTNEYGFDVFKTTFDSYIEMTEKEHDKIIQQASEENKWITGDKNGNPILINPIQPTKEKSKGDRLEELDYYLKETDWYVLRYIDEGTPIPDDIKKQRHEAREEISGLRKSLEKEEK